MGERDGVGEAVSGVAHGETARNKKVVNCRQNWGFNLEDVAASLQFEKFGVVECRDQNHFFM